MQKKYDVAVIGGGPIGGNIAKKIAEKKYNVAIFEQNKKIGEPLKCAGLVTPRIFDMLDISKEIVIQNQIKGANIHSPSGHILTIGGDKVHALVIDRTRFDKEIIQDSKKHGVDVFLENKILSAQLQANHIDIATSKKTEIKCKLLIGADGPHSKIRGLFQLPQPLEFLRGIGAEISGVNLDPNFVEIFVGNKTAPGFFAWIIPTNKKGDNARIGLCINQKSSNSPKHFFLKFLKNKHTSKYLDKTEIIKDIAGVVPLGHVKKNYSSNIMVVGDAAAQVKPTSGGGIYTGLLCAEHCSKIAVEALQKDDFSKTVLKKYQKLCSLDPGRELDLGLKFRKFFKNLSDKQLDKYIQRFSNTEISEIITKHGDIDYPSNLIKPLLKKSPSLLKLMPRLFKK